MFQLIDVLGNEIPCLYVRYARQAGVMVRERKYVF